MLILEGRNKSMEPDILDYRFGTCQTGSSITVSLISILVGLGLLAGAGWIGLVFVFLGSVALLLGLRFRVRVSGDTIEVRNFRVRSYPLHTEDVCFLFPSDDWGWADPSRAMWVSQGGARPKLAQATRRARSFPLSSDSLTMLELLLRKRSPESTFRPLTLAEMQKYR